MKRIIIEFIFIILLCILDTLYNFELISKMQDRLLSSILMILMVSFLMKRKIYLIIFIVLFFILDTLYNFKLISKALDMLMFFILIILMLSFMIFQRIYYKRQKEKYGDSKDSEES